MIRHFTVPLVKYNWTIDVFIGATCSNFKDIVRQSRVLRSDTSYCGSVYRRLKTCGTNTGFTCTDAVAGESVIIISYTSSMWEFVDTLFHEISHFSIHLYKILEIDNEEDYCYLNGYIGKTICEVLFKHISEIV